MRIVYLIFFLLILGSCKKAGMLKDISGTWQITKVIYSGGSLTADSIVSPANATLHFQRCSL